jgi:predicted DNA-binding transcriptional regulator YafY
MKLQETIERYRKIDMLIRREKTGSPVEFADKLGISRSQLYNYLDELRDYGAGIIYDRAKGSYMYMYPVEIRAEFSLTFPGITDSDGNATYVKSRESKRKNRGKGNCKD